MSLSGANGEKDFTITVERLSKRFNREWIFRDLSRTFQAGKKYAITGPNGSGKSTLLQVLWGQMPQTSGDIRYKKRETPIAVNDVHAHVAIATPYMDLIEEFTLREMLAFHFKLKKLRPTYTLKELPERMYLEHALDKQLMNFSSGMKQRLKLALACFSDADAYFLDEPGTNLDARAFQWYRSQLSSLPDNALVFIASNNADEYPADAEQVDITQYKPKRRS